MKKQARLGLISTSPHFGVCVSLFLGAAEVRSRRAGHGERERGGGGACVPERCFTSSYQAARLGEDVGQQHKRMAGSEITSVQHEAACATRCLTA